MLEQRDNKPGLRLVDSTGVGSFDGDGGGGDDGGMEDVQKRMTAVEQSIARIDATMPTLATKEELHKGFSDMVKWIVGTAFALGAAGITVMTFVLNNATPKAPAAQQPTIIVNVPSAAAPTTAASKP